MRLHQHWADGADAHFGTAVPGFPSMYILAGPNTFNSHNANPVMKEFQIDWIMRILRYQERIGAAALEVAPSAMTEYHRWLERAIASTIWPAGKPSWFKTPKGQVTNPWPASTRAYGHMLASADPAAIFLPLWAPA